MIYTSWILSSQTLRSISDLFIISSQLKKYKYKVKTFENLSDYS